MPVKLSPNNRYNPVTFKTGGLTLRFSGYIFMFDITCKISYY